MQPSCCVGLFFPWCLYSITQGQKIMSVSVLSINQKESLIASLNTCKKKSIQERVNENLYIHKERKNLEKANAVASTVTIGSRD